MTPRSLAEPARRASLHVLRTQDDGRLADLVKAGSHGAFEAIVERHRPGLIRYAGAIVGRDAADEVVQESLVCAHTALLRGDEIACLRAWLYRIVRNKSLNFVRDRAPEGLPLDERQPAVDTPELAAERRLTLRRVVDAVQALPTKQRDAIVLRELEGRSYDEIAGTLGVSDPAVRGLINRARMSVRRAAAAFAPLWPARMAELWSAGAVSGSGAARACATCVVAAVATFGGLPAAVPDRNPQPEAAAATEPKTRSTAEPSGIASTPRAQIRTVRAAEPVSASARDRKPAASRTVTPAPKPAEAQTEDSPTQPDADPKPIRSDEPRHRDYATYDEPRRRDGDGHRDGGDYDGYREPRPEYRTADSEPVLDDGFRKSSVGSLEGDGQRRDFHR